MADMACYVHYTAAPRPKPLSHLLALPFTPYEHSLIKDIAFEVPFPPALADDPMNVRPDLSYRGTAILQTLLCTRYIHAGLFAKAIDLDAQFNIVPPPTSGHSHSKNDEDAARAVVDERKQMISEIWSVLGGIEKEEIEEHVKEMMKKSQGMNMAQQMQRKVNALRLTQLTLQKVSGVNGVANTTSSPNKASSPYTTPKKKAAPQYFSPQSAGTSSASKSFILGRARHSLGSNLANTPGTPGLLFTPPGSQTQTPQNRSQTQLNPSPLPLSSGPNPASPSPRSTGASVGASRAQTTAGGGGRRKSAGLGSGVAAAPSSLFGPKAVPANQVKNAFYTPPAPSAPDVAQTTGSTTATNPANISTSADADRTSPSGSGTGATNGKEEGRESRRQSIRNEDVDMDGGDKGAGAGADGKSDGGDTVDNDHHDGATTEPNSSQQMQKVHSITEDDDVPQFEHSVFVAPPSPKPVRVSASASGSRRQSQTAQGPPRTRRALPKRSLPSVDKLIPGAFHEDTNSPTSPVLQPPPAPILEESAPAVAAKSPTKVTTSRSAHARGARRKIPGGFSVGLEDDDESEQEDEVAPLPPPLKKSRSSSRAVATTPGKKASTHLSRSAKTRHDEDEENESVILMRPTRRSSRLSAAGSVKGDDSGSEAGASPTKARSTRRSAKASGNESTSAGAAGTSATPRKKSTGRKKRVAEVTVQMARRS